MLRETRRVQMWVQDFLMDDPGIPRISANFVVKYNLLPRTDIAPFKKSHRRCTILENFAKFTGKHLSESLFFNKYAGLRSTTLFKKDSGTGVFLRTLRNF